MVSNNLNKRKLYIGGEWIEGETGEWLDVENPATSESCAVVACASENDLNKALESAEEGAADWFAEFQVKFLFPK